MTDVVPQNGHPQGAETLLLDELGNEFTAESVAALEASAISVTDAVRFGVRAVRHPDHVPAEINRYWVIGEGRGPGMLFPWHDLDRTVWQFRPDEPVLDDKGKPHKYVLPGDCGTFAGHLRPAEAGQPYLLIEGTKQGIAGAVWAPEGWGIVAIPGCNNWLGTDLSWAEDHRVIVFFDGDVVTNRDVYDAAINLKDALEAEGAQEISFAKLAGARAKEGLDDVLSRRAPERRTDYITRVAGAATGKLGRRPAKKKNPYFGDNGLLAQTASLAVLEGQPAALGSGGMIALYRDGVFLLDRTKEPLIEKVKTLLSEEFRPQWRATIEEFLLGHLYGMKMVLPDRSAFRLLNCRNGMLDLVNGNLLPHDPKYLSTKQIPIDWDPEATCPVYEEWLTKVIPDQAEALEEVASTMLDPTRTPAKAIFLFGPSRSGKSTFLRLMASIAGGSVNVSAVTLHQLSDNQFMSAELYQKMLNVAADLSAAHVSDTSLFKMLVGDDPVQANQKYGKTFTFTNQALFAFSANEIPTVSETSRAYVERISAFRFPYSFAGREDPALEDAMMRELPGILVRWVRAWQRMSERGAYPATNPDVLEEFETKSDRVARWVAMRCHIFPEAVGKLVDADQGESIQQLYVAFEAWAKSDGPGGVMSRPKFAERLRNLQGVGEVRLRHRNKNLGLNIAPHTGPDREIGRNGTNTPSEVWESVGGVGSSPHNPMDESSQIAGTSNDLRSQRDNVPAIALYGASPTLPTPAHTPQAEADELAAFFGTASPAPSGGSAPASRSRRPATVSDDDLASFFGIRPSSPEPAPVPEARPAPDGPPVLNAPPAPGVHPAPVARETGDTFDWDQ